MIKRFPYTYSVCLHFDLAVNSASLGLILFAPPYRNCVSLDKIRCRRCQWAVIFQGALLFIQNKLISLLPVCISFLECFSSKAVKKKQIKTNKQTEKQPMVTAAVCGSYSHSSCLSNHHSLFEIKINFTG